MKPIVEARKIVDYAVDGRFERDERLLPSHFSLSSLHETINLIVKLGDESKLKSEYKYHRDGDIHIVHVPDPDAYMINPVTNQPYAYSDWLILFKIMETKKFRNYYFLRTGTHEFLNISKNI